MYQNALIALNVKYNEPGLSVMECMYQQFYLDQPWSFVTNKFIRPTKFC